VHIDLFTCHSRGHLEQRADGSQSSRRDSRIEYHSFLLAATRLVLDQRNL